jgi:hypothetical protein
MVLMLRKQKERSVPVEEEEEKEKEEGGNDGVAEVPFVAKSLRAARVRSAWGMKVLLAVRSARWTHWHLHSF